VINLAKFSLSQKKVTYFAAILLALSGIMSYLNMGWLEDPDFSVKMAAIVVDYPGATPEEVELEVVEVLETKLQEMPQLKHLMSLSRDGRAVIKAEIKDQYWSAELPQVWDELRRKVREVEPHLPQGAYPPVIRDDYGFVFGFVLSLTSDGFEQHELTRYAKDIRRQLSLMPEIARIDLWGEQQRQVFVEFTAADVAEYALDGTALMRVLQTQNRVVDAGVMEVGRRQYAIQVTGELTSLEDIANVLVSGRDSQGKSQLVRLGDIADLSYDYQNPPTSLLRTDARPGIALALAPVQGSNVVKVGRQVERELARIQAALPVGLKLQKVAWQSDYVAEGINSFMINLVEAIVIVLLVLSLTMGPRMGLLIGAVGLGLTVLGSLTLMKILGIDLHRVSLGALVVAMGMMVDNAIVVADGFVVRVRQGMSRLQAAEEAANVPSLPLLGATIVAVMAFYPVFASPDSSGEYARTLFIVVGLSLMLSWVVSQTIIPLLCVNWIAVERGENGRQDAVDSGLAIFRHTLVWAIRRRFVFLLLVCALLAGAVGLFPAVKTQFFPDAIRNQFMVDYWAPEGTRLPVVAEDLIAIETQLQSDERVSSVSSFIGQGPPRFYLPVEPELPNPSYAQLLVTTHAAEDVDRLVRELQRWASDNQPQAMVRARKFGVGSGDTWPITVRVIGPAEADADTLRKLGARVEAVMRAHGDIEHINNDWRQRNLQVESRYSLQEGSWTGLTREDVAEATKRAVDGQVIGLLRERDERYPIVFQTKDPRHDDTRLTSIQVRPLTSPSSVPLSQVSKAITYDWYDPIIHRYDRRRTINVQAVAVDRPARNVFNELQPELANIPLPPGYHLELAGEFESSRDSIDSLKPGLPDAAGVMALIVVALFNAYRPALIIFAVVPFAIIGIVLGHIVTGVPLGFISILGGFSLSGMMIKNAVVLLDQLNLNKAAGMNAYDALLSAAQSRLMPVVNASLTTILGMLPLLQDIFWQSMAVTIMFGLMVGTVMTLLVLPVLYVVVYRVKQERP